MSGPTKAGEPSMEEILASIRKIIADDPSKVPSSPSTPAVPAVAGSGASAASKPDSQPSLGSPAAEGFGATKPGAMMGLGAALSASGTASPSAGAGSAMPSLGASLGESLAADARGVGEPGGRGNPAFGRLSEALRATFATSDDKAVPSFGSLSRGARLEEAPPVPFTPSTRNGTDTPPPMAVFRAEERSRSIESELDDILNEPLAGGRLGAADDSKTADSAGQPGSGQWAVWRTSPGKADEPKPEAMKDSSTGDPPAASSLAGNTPSLGRPSGGFYPSGGIFKPAAGPAPRIEPSLTPPGAAAPSSLPGTSILTGPAASTGPFGSAREGAGADSKTPAAQQPSPPAMPRFDPKVGSDAASTPPAAGDGKPAERGGGKPAPVVIAAMPSVASPPAAPTATASAKPAVPPTPTIAPSPVPPSAGPAPAATPVVAAPGAPAGGITVPLPPRTALFSRPFATTKPEPVASPTPSTPMPSSAMPPPADRLRPAVPGAPSRVLGRPPGPSAPASALDALAAGLAASNATTGSASPAPASGAEPTPGVSAASRSLEDSVADMIKPMLQKWIDDNMPRIIEKALRNETGSGGKSGT